MFRERNRARDSRSKRSQMCQSKCGERELRRPYKVILVGWGD